MVGTERVPSRIACASSRRRCALTTSLNAAFTVSFKVAVPRISAASAAVVRSTSIALIGQGWVYDVALGLQLGLLAAAAVGVGIARYYVLVSWATVVALWNYLRRGVPATWQPAEGRP